MTRANTNKLREIRQKIDECHAGLHKNGCYHWLTDYTPFKHFSRSLPLHIKRCTSTLTFSWPTNSPVLICSSFPPINSQSILQATFTCSAPDCLVSSASLSSVTVFLFCLTCLFLILFPRPCCSCLPLFRFGCELDWPLPALQSNWTWFHIACKRVRILGSHLPAPIKHNGGKMKGGKWRRN